MSWSRFFGLVTAFLLVGGCATVALGMAAAEKRTDLHPRQVAAPLPTPRPAYLPLTVAPHRSTPARRSVRPARTPATPTTAVPTTLRASAVPLSSAMRPAVSATVRSSAAPATHPHLVAPKATPTLVARRSARTASTDHSSVALHATRGTRLPLRFRTHHARQVITVVARSRSSTTARLQAWRKVRGGGWVRRGPLIRAHIGSDGMTWHAREWKSATPMGSFTLTHAFGHKRNPGTALPYLHTRPSDWWISQAGPLYNTHQRCSSNCPFTQGAPNEHLYYETPYYNYAVVIDYNTRNAPGGVRQGRGSAFFLHVHPAGTGATAGCVSIPQPRLVSIMRWLRLRAHPRILMGVR